MVIWAWAAFLLIIAGILAIDLGLLNRDAHSISLREAAVFTAFTVLLAFVFAGVIYLAYNGHWLGLGMRRDGVDGALNDGRLASVKFITGYLIELSLSMDNVFVIALIFHHMRVPAQYQHRVLFWGILGALVMRGAMIGLGAGLVARYEWILYVFGAFLLVTAFRMLLSREDHSTPDEAAVVRFLRKHFPVSDQFHGQHFLVKQGARRYLTPLAIALVLVETSDLIFAVDSIPAIFAITADPFLVFTSNIFAILCLRSLYFGLANLIERFRYLRVSLSLVLALVGAKMLAAHPLSALLGPSTNFWLLGAIVFILVGGAVASMVVTKARPSGERNP